MALPTRVQRSSYDPIDMAQREFDSMLGRFFTGGGRQQDGGSYLAPYGVDVREDADHIYVEAELPGFKKDDVDITLENQTLTITAERDESREQRPHQQQGRAQQGKEQKGQQQGEQQLEQQQWPQGEYLLRERRYSRFQRSFTLPPTVDEQSVNAKLNDGVLTITLNKREETKPRKVQVS